jgi:hypothetical protein
VLVCGRAHLPPLWGAGPRRELSSHANQNLFFEIEVRKIVAK